MTNFRQKPLGIWQEAKVSQKQKRINDILLQMKKYRYKPGRVTELARVVADRLNESTAVGESAVAEKICSSSLLRTRGPYRRYLDAFMFEYGGATVKGGCSYGDAVEKRYIASLELQLENSKLLKGRLQEEVSRLKSRQTPNNEYSRDQLASEAAVKVAQMGKACTVIFDLLLSTGYVKYDESTGDLLAVGRSRKVVVCARDIAAYLNWRFKLSGKSIE